MKTGAILQARMGSSRLRGKVLMKIDHKLTVIESVISQLKFARRLDEIIVATTQKEEDRKIIEKIKKYKVKNFCGNEDDVLDRYLECAKKFHLTTIIRITCDNPLIDPELVDKAIEKFELGDFDCVTNVFPRSFPQGTEVEVFSINALEKAWNESSKKSEREHVTPYFYKNPEKFSIFNQSYSRNLSHLRWTVDRKNDLRLICEIKKHIKKSPILIGDILNLFEKNPELIDINKENKINEGYNKSVKEDS